MKTFRTGDIVEDSDGWTAVGVVVGIVEGMDLYGRTVYNVDFGDLPLALVAEELGLVERRGAYLYPRWRIVKRPWQPKPGAFYLQLVKDTPPKNWTVLYYASSSWEDGFEQSRHCTHDEALKAAIENIRFNLEHGMFRVRR